MKQAQRTGFVKPARPGRGLPAARLFDVEPRRWSIENADVLYDLAVTYGAKRDALMRDRQAYIKRVLAQREDKGPSHDTPCAICPQPE